MFTDLLTRAFRSEPVTADVQFTSAAISHSANGYAARPSQVWCVFAPKALENGHNRSIGMNMVILMVLMLAVLVLSMALADPRFVG